MATLETTAKRLQYQPFDVIYIGADKAELAVEKFGDWRSNRRDLARSWAQDLADTADTSVGVYVQGRKGRALLQFVVQPFNDYR